MKAKIDSSDYNTLVAIQDMGQGIATFWLHLHDTEELAKKKAKKVNAVLKKIGIGPRCKVDFARNFNFRGKDWGTAIQRFTQLDWKKLEAATVQYEENRKHGRSLADVIISERRRGIIE